MSPKHARLARRSPLREAALGTDRAVPLYKALSNKLKERIRGGEFSQNSEFPSERELKAQYGVSEVTIKRAIAELATEGLVETSRGRRTRVVSRVATTQYGATVQGIIEGIFQHSWNTETRILFSEFEQAPDEVARAMNLPPNSVVQKTVNLARRDRELFAHATTYIPSDVASRLSAIGLSALPYLLQFERAGYAPRSGQQLLSACPAPDDVAEALETEARSPMLKLVRTLVDGRGSAVEHVVAYFPWNRFEYFISLSDSKSRERG